MSMDELAADPTASGPVSRLDATPVGRAVRAMAAAMAVAGGLALIAVVGTVAASVSGRALNDFGLGSIRGDYELVEMGVGFAVFSFLAWAHLVRGHAVVTVLTDRLGPKANFVLQINADAAMMGAAWFIAIRHAHGTADRFAYKDMTALLRVPMGWVYLACLAGAGAFALVSVYVLVRTVLDYLDAGRVRGARR
ncbi:TRAP transporter small permease [Pelagibacterium montanilacus]|uniref:TRAP transporter small permease n=1 Tax=Pelagibacterium montanilacus TaxID=2185280 RepID=UPI002482F489|nr:TRAP transporter small permease [Pelagibacterium montanilacus]